jgi:hypothetical protein
MKTKMLTVTIWDICYEGGEGEIVGYTAKDWAAFRRTKKFKTVLSKKILASIAVKIKTR